MKTLSTLLSLVVLISLTGCFTDYVRPSDTTDVEEYVVDSYHQLDVSNAFDVDITFSETEEKIEIEANENLLPHVIVQVEGDKLVIKLEERISVRGGKVLKANIITSHIDDFEASGASKIRLLNTLEGEDVSIELSGASDFIGDLSVQTLESELSGASVLNISGSSDTFDVEIDGASHFKDYDFSTEYLFAELEGASSGYVTVNKEIIVDASGASSLNYKGEGAVIQISTSGASSVNKRN